MMADDGDDNLEADPFHDPRIEAARERMLSASPLAQPEATGAYRRVLAEVLVDRYWMAAATDRLIGRQSHQTITAAIEENVFEIIAELDAKLGNRFELNERAIREAIRARLAVLSATGGSA